MPPTLSGALVAALRERIVDGDLAPGEKLPSETRLAAEHQVSRTVVREAIARLNLEGLVHTRRGSGSYALAPPSGDAGDAGPARTLEDRLALIELRLGIETQAAALAAERRSDAALATMADRLGDLDAARDHPATAMRHDFTFHRLVAQAAGNRYLLDAVDRLGVRMIAMPRGRLSADGAAGRFATVAQEHQAVLDALTAADPLAAAAAMRVHLAGSRRRLLAEAGAAPR